MREPGFYWVRWRIAVNVVAEFTDSYSGSWKGGWKGSDGKVTGREPEWIGPRIPDAETLERLWAVASLLPEACAALKLFEQFGGLHLKHPDGSTVDLTGVDPLIKKINDALAALGPLPEEKV